MKVSVELAEAISDIIVENCLYGHDSHGAILIPRFVKDLEVGKIKLDAKSEITQISSALAHINGNRVFGQITMRDAMTLAIKMAA